MLEHTLWSHLGILTDILGTGSNKSFLPLIHRIQHNSYCLATCFLSFYGSNAPVTARGGILPLTPLECPSSVPPASALAPTGKIGELRSQKGWSILEDFLPWSQMHSHQSAIRQSVNSSGEFIPSSFPRSGGRKVGIWIGERREQVQEGRLRAV